MVTVVEDWLKIQNEGEIVNFDKSNTITKNAVEFYGSSKFVYITNRVNSYSVDPSVYFDISKLKTLVGFAVVSKDYTAKSNAEIEKLFLNKPMEVFDVLEDAITWAKSVLD